MPEVKSFDEREEDWRRQHARLQEWRASLVACMYVMGVIAVLGFALAAILALGGLPSESLRPLFAAACCSTGGLCIRSDLRPEFKPRRWRITKTCENIALVCALIGLTYMAATS